MIHKLYILFLFLFLLSCKHPEGKKYERNQGNSKDFNTSNDEVKINSVQSDEQEINIRANRNVLKMELQNRVHNLIQHKFTEYLNLLYVIDVPEKEIKALTNEINWVRNQFGDDYLDRILKRVDNQKNEVIIAVENNNAVL